MNPKRIVFFIGSLRSGGKERRLVELLTYLQDNNNFQLYVIVTNDDIHYSSFKKLNVSYIVMKKAFKKFDFTVIYKFYKLCKSIKPDIINTWGTMQTFYAIPTVLRFKIRLINSQITSAPPGTSKINIYNHINFKYSDVILSNSKAGLISFNPPPEKSKVIYNGLNLARFENLIPPEEIRSRLSITKPYLVVMTASFTANKNYNLFFKIAKYICAKRDDVTFIAVGRFGDDLYMKSFQISEESTSIIMTGEIDYVESVVNACHVGVLFSPNGEGISNAILEYMALGKPVIANDAGGTNELITNNENGYLIKEETVEEIADLINKLLNNKELRVRLGESNIKKIEQNFTLDRMGKAFIEVYNEFSC
jgi:glycosyltransferase involved in cell wall biosynthesis